MLITLIDPRDHENVHRFYPMGLDIFFGNAVWIGRTIYHRKVDVDMLNAVKSVLADVSSVSPSSEQRGDYELGESLYRVRVY